MRGRWLCAAIIFVAIMAPRAPFSSEAASIVGSRHDLSTQAGCHFEHITGQFNQYGEVCVYCHTPHHASTIQKPLWNRPDTTTVYQVYTSATMDNTPGQPGPSSCLCLGCHDGTIAVDKVLNVPNAGYVVIAAGHGRMVYPGVPGSSDCGRCHDGSSATVRRTDFRRSFFTNNLRNSHPIGMSYPSTTEFKAPASGKFTNGVKLVEGQVECTSCHNVHDPVNKPFLWADNGCSVLCLTCHEK